MNQGRDLKRNRNVHFDRRRWLAGVAGTFGLAWGAHQVVGSGPDLPVEIKPVSDGPPDPAVFEHQGYRILAFPAKRSPERTVPIAFLFGGNGMGAVVRSVQADQLAVDLTQRGIAAVIVNYPNLTSAADMISRIIDPMVDILESAWAKQNRIDVTRIGAAGFSAGGLIATLLATRYRDMLPFRLRSALNFYGPVDLRQWFAFHAARAEAADTESVDPKYRGLRGPADIGHSPHGTIVCRDLSRSVRAKVAENIGGLTPGKLTAFSEAKIWDASDSFEPIADPASTPRLVGAFGTRDDNCDAVFQPKLLRRLGNLHQLDAFPFVYDGPHGVSWRACPRALDSFLEPLCRESASHGTDFAAKEIHPGGKPFTS